ncbi:mucin-2-like [Sycon ciliatum]|uniref:mucin-2-like n=1 Tax=Sycon ciliatum TaxID=27933 RepID=UPI0031F70C99
MTPATSHDRQQEQAFPLSQHTVTRRKAVGRNFRVGDKIEAEDSQKKWYPARILQVDEEDSCVLIHFDGFSARYDEWIEMASPKLRMPIRRGRDKTALQHLRVGESVLARWTDGKFYPARITEISEESYRVEFYDGYSRTLSPNHIRPADPTQQQRSRAHSRSGSSGRSSGDTANTPTAGCAKQLVNSRRRSRNSSAVSSAATTPANSYPVSPAGNGEHTPTNGLSQISVSHQSLKLSTRVSFVAEQQLPADLPLCSTILSECVMSSPPLLAAQDPEPLGNNSSSKHSGNGGSDRPRHVNGNGSTSHAIVTSTSPGTGFAVPPHTTVEANGKTFGSIILSSASILERPPASTAVFSTASPAVAQQTAGTTTVASLSSLTRQHSSSGTQNGFHLDSSLSTGDRSAATTAAAAPTASSDMCRGASPAVRSEFSPDMTVVTPPRLPEFTPLSPNHSPHHHAAPSSHPAATISPLVGCAPATTTHSTSCGLVGTGVDIGAAVGVNCASVANCPSPTSDGVVACEPLVCPMDTSMASPTCTAPTSVVTPNDSPIVASAVAVCPVTVSTASFVQSSPATEDVSMAMECARRHEEAPAPDAQPPVPVRHRTDSETSNSGRSKRKKLDGVLAPPPARIAPKEVIAVQDHNPYKCKVCEKTFRKWPLLESHYKHYHPDNQRDLQQAKKESDKRPSLPAVTGNDADRMLKLAQKKRNTSSKSVSATAMSSSTADVPQPSVTRQRSTSATTASAPHSKRKDAPDVVTQRQSSAPASLNFDSLSSPMTPDIPTFTTSLSSPAGDSAAAVASASTQSLLPSSRGKRKSSGTDGVPAKRGRPPSSSLSTESTPRLPMALGKGGSLASNTGSEKSKSSRDSAPVRVPKSSRRSLSFSSDSVFVELSPEADSPKVKTDVGCVEVPADAVICCPCRDLSFRGTLVRCTGCRTYQHLICLPVATMQQSWLRYQCRACTHPSGKRRGARDKLPADWFCSQSLCRNPAPLLSQLETALPADVKPFTGSAPVATAAPRVLSSPPAAPPRTKRILSSERECLLAAKFVDLQHAASQDILSVGEVLSATKKQLDVIKHPEKPFNCSAINRLLPPMPKTDASLVSPISINTEQIGGTKLKHPAHTPSREARAMAASGLSFANHLRSPGISPDTDVNSMAAVAPLHAALPPSLHRSASDGARPMTGMASARNSMPLGGAAMRYRSHSHGSPVAGGGGSVVPSIQQLVDGPGLSHLPSTTAPVTTTKPLSPSLVSGSSTVISPQSTASSSVMPSPTTARSCESPLPATFNVSPHSEFGARPATLLSSRSVPSSPSLSRKHKQHPAAAAIFASGQYPAATAGSPMSVHTPTLSKAAAEQMFFNGALLPRSTSASPMSRPVDDMHLADTCQTLSSATKSLSSAPFARPGSVKQKSAGLTADSGKGNRRSSAVESEAERNLRVQAAQTEMLSRVREIHSSVGRRLNLLEELVFDLESMEASFRSEGPLSSDFATQQQLVLFQSLFHAVDKLEHVTPP